MSRLADFLTEMEKVAASDLPTEELADTSNATWDLTLQLVPVAFLNASAFQNRHRELREALEAYRSAPSAETKRRLQDQTATFKTNVLGR